MPPILADLQTLARQAGEILRAGRNQHFQIDHKGIIDLVTEVDRRSEAFLIGEIRQRFPQDGIVAEESGSLAGRACCCWYIDPLDGTVNYAHGVPAYCVSLAYAEDGVVRLGAIYDPVHDELFSAESGRGAMLNGQPLRVSAAQDLDQSLLVTGFPYDIRSNPNNNLDQYARFALCSQGVRRLGSAALDLCYVAAGRFDGFWELSLNPWDLAAGGLIASQAGAQVTTVAGGPDYLRPPCSILAANPKIHAQMLHVLENGPN
jgi:myo-inositol-1(or 4)-monophosphatase